jgi:multiple sugar transport system substrate-binding protein
VDTRVLRRVAMAAALLVVAACSGAQAPAEARTLTVIMADDWAETPAVLDVVRQFEAANPGVRVDMVPRPFNQIHDDSTSAVENGQPFDVVQHHAFAAGAVGLAEPLDRWWSDGTFEEDAYFPGAIEDVAWGDTLYGVQLDVNALFLIRDPGTPEPATFDDLREAAEAAAAEGGAALTLSANSWEAYGWIRANGGEVVEIADDGTPTFLLDSPEVVETLEFLGALVEDEVAYGPLTRDVSDDAFELFGAGDTAMLTSGTWSVSGLDTTYPDRDYELSVMPVGQPGAEGGTALGGSSLYVGRGSPNVELAVAFIAALTADDAAVRLALEEGRFPPKPELYDELGDAPGTAVLEDQLPVASAMRLVAFPEATLAFSQALEEVLTGRATAAEALAEAQARAEAAETPS